MNTQSDPGLYRSIKRNFIGQLYVPSAIMETFCTSPDLRHIAFVSQGDGQQCVVADGVDGDLFDAICTNTITFSPDGTHVAYFAAVAGKQLMVVDGQQGPRYSLTRKGSLVFSPDSQHVAYGAQKGKQWCVVLDGEEQEFFDLVGNLTFSPDSQHLAYCALRCGQNWLILDQPTHPGDKAVVVADDNLGQKYALTFSPDSQQFAYAIHIDEKNELAVRNGIEQDRYRGVLGDFTFSPDSQHLLYAAGNSRKQFMVLDGKPCRLFDRLVIGHNVVFSPDGHRFAYVVKQGFWRYVVVDERTGHPFNGILEKTVTFSPDGKRTSFVGRIWQTRFVVVDGKIQRKFPDPMAKAFSPDSRHFVIAARAGPTSVVAFDDTLIYRSENIIAINQAGIVFDAANTFHFIEFIGGAVHSCEIEL